MADDENDPTAPFNELEAFDSIWQALNWKQIKKRIPLAIKKTSHNRYFLANFVYLVRRLSHHPQDVYFLFFFTFLVLCHWNSSCRFYNII